MDENAASLPCEEIMALWKENPSQGKGYFNLLYQRHHRRTFRFFLSMAHNVEAAEDLNQTLYMKLFASHHTYAGSGKFTAWLFQIARRVFYDAVIRPAPGKAVDVNPGVYHELEEARDRSSNRPDRKCEKGELLQCFLDSFDQLSTTEKIVLTNHYFFGETVDDLTKRLGLENSAGARAVKARALRALKAALLARYEKLGEKDAEREETR